VPPVSSQKITPVGILANSHIEARPVNLTCLWSPAPILDAMAAMPSNETEIKLHMYRPDKALAGS
jgi:hypothetical protein